MVENDKVYHLDHLGTPQELSDSNDEIVWKARYKTYGNVAVKEVDEVENNLRFQGQYFDEETGLHYNRHRYYNPNIGQFTTQDPIGLLGGVNNYQYAPNPVGWVDPFGLTCKELPASVLNDENLLGSGAFKEAFIIDKNNVFLIPKKQVQHDRPASIEDLKHEKFLLDFIKGFSLPTLHIENALGVVSLPDGSKVEGLIAERKMFNGKDFTSIRKGKNPQGVTLADVHDAVTPKTLEELKKMEEKIIKERIVIKDFQVMYGKDGMPTIADPLDAYAGKYATDKEIDDTVRALKNNMIMIENILEKKNIKNK